MDLGWDWNEIILIINVCYSVNNKQSKTKGKCSAFVKEIKSTAPALCFMFKKAFVWMSTGMATVILVTARATVARLALLYDSVTARRSQLVCVWKTKT